MEPTFGPPRGNPTAWDFSASADRFAQPAILLVEDDRDIREMLATLLEMAGFRVQACESAERGLNALREGEYDLVLTDYALPRQSGLWLLEHAEAEGLIDGTPVLIVTAHPSVEAARRYEIIQKPFDLDDLIERVRYRIEGERRRRRRNPAVRDGGRAAGSGNGNGHGSSSCPEPVELILYVSPHSTRSHADVRNIKNMLKRFNPSRVKLTVCDLARDPAGGIEESVAFTHALVRSRPGPRTFILGHVTNPDLVMELLADCDTEGP